MTGLPAPVSAPGGPAGLLEKLLAAVRPEFRADVLVFDPADPVFGGDLCASGGCGRTARYGGLCYGHHQRWAAAGRPEQFPVSAGSPWHGHGPLLSCRVPGCGFGVMARRLCPGHVHAWRRAGSPDVDSWLAAAGPAAWAEAICGPTPGPRCATRTAAAGSSGDTRTWRNSPGHARRPPASASGPT